MDVRLNENVNELLIVQAILHGYPTVVALVPQMVLHGTTLDGKLIEIKLKAQATGISIRGLYDLKKDSKASLVDITDGGCAAMRSLAKATDDAELHGFAKIKGYQLDRLLKNELIAKCQSLYDRAVLVHADLEDHGFDADDMTDWHDKLVAFTNDAETPRVGTEVHKKDLEELHSMVSDALNWLTDTVDDTAKAFKRKNPSFYTLYKFAREKHHQGSRRTAEEMANDGDYVINVLHGEIKIAGFPILVGKNYLIKSLKDVRLRYWTQDTPKAPEVIPEDASLLEMRANLVKSGEILGAPDKPYLFFGNGSDGMDGEVGIGIEDLKK